MSAVGRARSDHEIRRVRDAVRRALSAFDLPDPEDPADAAGPWRWDPAWMNAAWQASDFERRFLGGSHVGVRGVSYGGICVRHVGLLELPAGPSCRDSLWRTLGCAALVMVWLVIWPYVWLIIRVRNVWR